MAAIMHVLIIVSEQGTRANNGGRLIISFIEWLILNSVSLKFRHTNAAGIFKWHNHMIIKGVFLITLLLQNFKVISQQAHDTIMSLWHQNVKTSFWRHNDVISVSCVPWDAAWLSPSQICNFTKNKQGVSQWFHLHAWVPPAAVPGWVDPDERIFPSGEYPMFTYSGVPNNQTHLTIYTVSKKCWVFFYVVQ